MNVQTFTLNTQPSNMDSQHRLFNTQTPLLIGHAPLFGRDGCLSIIGGSVFNRDRHLFIGERPASSCGTPVLNTRHSVFALEACLPIRRRSMFNRG
ncbi:hypothetical protein [Methylomonas sp. UP202]|uniref:hypothetical protein n=1 Tax=Methylomonas sp. UP202 TaxID=3040943 RepID=UPI00247ACCDB|nr:hypothetical protein [Methylomonas sp. UP202]WGS87990.1 hypothetical protein QC632_09570 [Methylomonas sp. UP202]